MPKLHLVGISADRRGLLLSDDPRGSKTELVLEVDQTLLSAIAELRRLQVQDVAALSPALPTRRDSTPTSPAGRLHSLLAPKEIQHRLRQGVPVETVAAEAGVDASWVERFAAPVAAEQARVVAQARRAVYLRPRLGPSADPLDASVIANAFERGARLGLADIEQGWSACQRDDGKWTVRFAFEAKGRSQAAEWDFSPAAAELSARNLLASELGHRAVAPGAPHRPKAVRPAVKPAAVKPAAIEPTQPKPTPAGLASPPSPERARTTKPRGSQPGSARSVRARRSGEAEPPRPIGAVFAPPGASSPQVAGSSPQARPSASGTPAASAVPSPSTPQNPAVDAGSEGGASGAPARAVQPPPGEQPPPDDPAAGVPSLPVLADPVLGTAASRADGASEVDPGEESGSHQAALFVDPPEGPVAAPAAPGDPSAPPVGPEMAAAPARPSDATPAMDGLTSSADLEEDVGLEKAVGLEKGSPGEERVKASTESARAIPDRDSIAAVLVATLSSSKRKDRSAPAAEASDPGTVGAG